jgi:glutathione synthase/RimK-type ligase-like ATP-grasp enzyme
LSIEMLPAASFTWRPGYLSLNGSEFARGEVSGLWRRPGRPNLTGYDGRYATFMTSECEDAFRGAITALDVRWISRPQAIADAELKLWQLQVADNLGIAHPRTVVTNSFGSLGHSQSSRLVAKPVRYGLVASEPEPTVAFTESVEPSDLRELEGSPIIVQDLADTAYHLRITTVGDQQFVAGLRADKDIDWRREVGNHRRFQRHALPNVAHEAGDLALIIASALGLGLTAQDWLLTADGDVLFLEANPSGQWLFLDDLFDGAITDAVAFLLTRPETRPVG